jgi:DNA invertase Pin-like site-specific DNA recombinase
LRLDGRDALKQLIEDVEREKADFDVILVYDVSRWGRFQDADESAYYEYICKRAGINVRYCAEQFENDGSPVSTIVKGVKRAMAGEYSRELSAKVFKGQCKLIELGFRQGGPAGYGLRRMLVDQNNNHKGILRQGEYKSLQTDRIILVPGSLAEVETVKWIYELFLNNGKSEMEIAEILNRKAIKTDLNRSWSRGTVHQVLTNEKYIGNNIYNRTSFKLKNKRVRNPEEMWIRANGVFEPIVDPQSFYTVQGIIMERNRCFSNEEMLDRLKKLLDTKGRLSGFLIDETVGMPASSSYRVRFGSLIRAYRLIGYTPDRDYQYIEINRTLRKMHFEVIAEVIMKIREMGGIIEQDEPTDLLKINEEFTTSLVIARCRETQAGSLRWLVRLDIGLEPDITVVLRMDPINENIKDYYLLPLIDITFERLRLSEENGTIIDSYRFDTLDFFFGMAERARIQVAA